MQRGPDMLITMGMGPLPLQRPVINVRGTKVKELDGSAATADYDVNTDLRNFLVSYIIPPLSLNLSDSDSIYTFDLPASLQQGIYNVTAKVSMITNYPELVGIGKSPINQTDVTEVNGLTEVMAKDLFVGETFGVQQEPTLLTAISSDKEGAAITVSSVTGFELRVITELLCSYRHLAAHLAMA